MEDIQINYTDDITAVYEETVDHLQIKSHFHNTYELIYVLEGKASFRINTRTYDAVPGSLIFINHLESHSIEILEFPYKRFYLLITPQLFQNVITEPRLSSIFRNRPEDFDHVFVLGETERDRITELFTQIKTEMDLKHDFRLMRVSALLQLLFIELYRNNPGRFPLTDLAGSTHTILKIQKYIDEHYLDNITLSAVSEMFYMDMCYLSRLFKRICGFSFREYIILLKLSKAKDLLMESDMSITKVCSFSGFGNVNHFIRIFRKSEGITPYQYRKTLGKQLQQPE